ncbi:MAG TPA: hypothetical protein VFA93_03060 [Patescibacteria group bacterium]|nr:hypothetical protein [Patescibacteria group bacterium]
MSPERKTGEQKPFNLEESFDSAIGGIKDELQRAHATNLIIVQSDDRAMDITRTGTLRRKIGNSIIVPIINTARTYVGNYYMIKHPEKAYKKRQSTLKSTLEVLLNTSIQTYDNEDIQREAIDALNDAWKKAKKLPTSRG